MRPRHHTIPGFAPMTYYVDRESSSYDDAFRMVEAQHVELAQHDAWVDALAELRELSIKWMGRTLARLAFAPSRRP